MPIAPPDLLIREVDPHDPAELAAYQDVYVRAERAELPDAPVYSAEEAYAVLTREPVGAFFEGYAAFERGQMVGEGLITGSLTDSLQTTLMWAWVPPEHQRRGIGGALVDFMATRSAKLGRGVLHSRAAFPAERRGDASVLRFAAAHGFTVANFEVQRRLALPVDAALLDALAREAAAFHRDYTIRTFTGPIPAEWAQGYCDVQNTLRLDAPQGDLVTEPARRTPDVIADQDDEISSTGRLRVTALAFDRDDTIGALTTAVVSPAGQPNVSQWGTVVRRADRGHRLGLGVKSALTRAVQEAAPDKAYIMTENAETNAHMIAINERLGFRPYALSADLQRLLPGVQPAAES